MRRRLLLGAVVQVVLLGVVAVFSIGRLDTIHVRANETVERNASTSALLTEVGEGSGKARDGIYRLVLARTPEARSAAADELTSFGVSFVAKVAELKEIEPDPEFQRALAEVEQSIAAQTPVFAKAIEAAKAGARMDDVSQLLEPLQAQTTEKLTNLFAAHRTLGERAVKAADGDYRRARLIIAALTGLALVLGWIIGSWLARGVARNARRIVDVATDLADGNLSARSDVTSRDEFGEIASALNTMADDLERLVAKERDRTSRLRASIDAINRFAGRMTSGDLTARADVQNAGELAALATNLNTMAESLASISSEVQRGSHELSGNATSILSAVSQHNSSTAEQAASIAQTSVTIDEVRTNAEQAAAQAAGLATQARSAVQVSDEGGRAVQSLLTGMDEIDASVADIAEGMNDLARRIEAIGKINESVNDLAEQSNMLALNATIEAAKAGEHGRGFGVVADEVRNLSVQSKQATAHVQTILQEIRESAAKAVQATARGTQVASSGRTRAGEAGKVIERLAGAIRETAIVADKIASGAKEQAVGMDQIGRAMVDVSKTTNQISQGAQQTESAASNLTDLATRLATTTRRYQLREDTPDTTS